MDQTKPTLFNPRWLDGLEVYDEEERFEIEKEVMWLFYRYAATGEMPECSKSSKTSKISKAAFAYFWNIKVQLDLIAEHRETLSEKRAKAGAKGGKQKQAKAKQKAIACDAENVTYSSLYDIFDGDSDLKQNTKQNDSKTEANKHIDHNNKNDIKSFIDIKEEERSKEGDEPPAPPLTLDGIARDFIAKNQIWVDGVMKKLHVDRVRFAALMESVLLQWQGNGWTPQEIEHGPGQYGSQGLLRWIRKEIDIERERESRAPRKTLEEEREDLMRHAGEDMLHALTAAENIDDIMPY